MRWAATVGLEISIHETPAPSMGTTLPRDHILSYLHPDNDNLRHETPWGETLNWFACAAIAVYGFNLGMPIPSYVLPPNENFLHAVEWFDLDVSTALFHRLIQPETQNLNHLLKFVDFDPYNPDSVVRTEKPSQQAQLMNKLAKRWMTTSDLSRLELKSFRRIEMWQTNFMKEEELFNQHIDMPNLLRLCIRSLLSHPMRLKSLLIGSLPQEPTDLGHITQQIPDQILRMMILDSDFAKVMREQTHQVLKNPSAGARSAFRARQKKKKLKKSGTESEARDALTAGLQCSQEDTDHFCCAVVLLGVIRQRVDYLRSGDDVRQCVNDWPTVNLS